MSIPMNPLLATISGIFLVLASTTALANTIVESEITMEEWALLPAYCPHTLPYKGYTPVNRAKWEPLMGGGEEFFGNASLLLGADPVPSCAAVIYTFSSKARFTHNGVRRLSVCSQTYR